MPQLLGYPGYHLAEPFGARHPADAAAAAAALPFFSMMATPQSPFQLPPHLLFPGYHASAAAAAAADAAYRQEMYKHRQSVDSAASAESLSRYTPPHALRQQQHQQQQQSPVQTPTPEPESHPQPAASPIDVCLGADEDDSHSHSQSPHSIIHTPIAIRATPPQQQLHVSAPASASASPTPTHGSSSHSPSHSPLSFAAKMQSLSPVSVCSIGGETGAARTAAAAAGAGGVAMAQDGPMDLSMKTSRSSVHSFNDSDVCSLQDEHESTMAPRRKFNQLEAEYSSSGSTTSLSSSSATATATASFTESASVKRQKMSAGEFSGFAATSAMRGIFVCV